MKERYFIYCPRCGNRLEVDNETDNRLEGFERKEAECAECKIKWLITLKGKYMVFRLHEDTIKKFSDNLYKLKKENKND